jgi:hypothetical protein
MKITIKKHREIGAKLQEIEHFFGDLETDVSRDQGKSCDAAKAARTIYKKLTLLRSEMEGICFRSYPGDADIDVYYPDGPADQTGILEKETLTSDL